MDEKNNPQDPQPERPYEPSPPLDSTQQDASDTDGTYPRPVDNTPQPVESNSYQEVEPAQERTNTSPATDPYEPQESTRATTQFNDPANQQTSPVVTPIRPQPNKKRRLAIITAIIVLLLAGLTAAYFLWYQNPNKVVSDGIMNAIQAKTVNYTGNLTTSGDTKVKIDFNGANVADSGRLGANVTFDFQNASYTLAADALVDNNADVYFKVKEIDALVENYRSFVPPESQELLDQLIAKVNDKWIKVSAAELKNYSPDAAQAQKCLTDATKKLQEDRQVKNQLVDLYKKHPFIVIDETLGSKDGSLGYRLLPNKEESIVFSKGLRETDMYRSLQQCDPSFTIKDEDLTASDSDSTPVELWVDRWSHNITKLTVNDKEEDMNVNMVFEPEFNKDITIETPSDATTLKQLQEDVQALIQSAAVTAAP